MATALQDLSGKWKIEGLKIGDEFPDDLSFTGTISYKKEESVPVTITKTPISYDTTWETPLGVGLVASEIKVNCPDVPKKVEGKWYIYVPVSGFKQSDIKPFEAKLSVDCTNKTPGSQSATATLEILCNTVWEASVNVPWITIPTTTGSGDFSESISFDTNTGTTSRTGVITVTSLNKTETVTITQSGFVPEISLTAPATIDATAKSISYTATSNVDDVVVELSDGQRKTDKIGSFEIPENTSSDQVTYTLTAYCANYTTYAATTTVIQNGIELLTPEVKSFDISTTYIEKQGGEINLTAETLPIGHTISVEDLPSWITVDQSSTAQNWVGKVSKNEDVNERSYVLTGTVTTNTDPEYDGTTSLTKTWTVTQAGNNQLSVSPTSLAYVSTGGVSTLAISNPDGYSWTITGQPEWISLSTTAGTGDANISVTAQENPRTTNRDGQFVVNDIDNNKHITVSLEQEGGVLPVSCDFEFTYNTGVTVTNITRLNITFDGESTEAFKLKFPNGAVGTSFVGTVTASTGPASVETISIGDETQGSLMVYREGEDATGKLSYAFDGTKDDSQKVRVKVTFHNDTDEKPDKTIENILDGGDEIEVNFYDWFNTGGRVDVSVKFEITVYY